MKEDLQARALSVTRMSNPSRRSRTGSPPANSQREIAIGVDDGSAAVHGAAFIGGGVIVGTGLLNHITHGAVIERRRLAKHIRRFHQAVGGIIIKWKREAFVFSREEI